MNTNILAVLSLFALPALVPTATAQVAWVDRTPPTGNPAYRAGFGTRRASNW